MRKIPALLSFLLLAVPLAASQTPPPAKPAGQAESPLQKPLDPAKRAGQANPPLKSPPEGATRWMKAGKKAAVSQQLKAIEKDPAVTPLVLSLIGALYVEVGRPQEAMAVLKPLADADDAQP